MPVEASDHAGGIALQLKRNRSPPPPESAQPSSRESSTELTITTTTIDAPSAVGDERPISPKLQSERWTERNDRESPAHTSQDAVPSPSPTARDLHTPGRLPPPPPTGLRNTPPSGPRAMREQGGPPAPPSGPRAMRERSGSDIPTGPRSKIPLRPPPRPEHHPPTGPRNLKQNVRKFFPGDDEGDDDAAAAELARRKASERKEAAMEAMTKDREREEREAEQKDRDRKFREERSRRDRFRDRSRSPPPRPRGDFDRRPDARPSDRVDDRRPVEPARGGVVDRDRAYGRPNGRGNYDRSGPINGHHRDDRPRIDHPDARDARDARPPLRNEQQPRRPPSPARDTRSYSRPPSAMSDRSGPPRSPASRRRPDKGEPSRPATPERVLSEPAPAPAPPQPTELYERIVQVGEGTYGKVYKARNVETNELVALKRIRMEAEKDGFPVTAVREIKLLQSLRHPNVVNLSEIMVSKGHVYMVFEYMDHDLTGILHHPSIQLSAAHLKSLMQQFLEGLGFIHRRGILHRDLKGSNILLSRRGELKIADFGLARFYARGKRNDYTNRVITQWYKPPELLFGATVYDAAVDMWSAGCIFLELFERRPVFQGQDEIHQLDAIFEVVGTPTGATWPDVYELPWYELVKPQIEVESRLRDTFSRHLTSAGLDLAQSLLALNPSHRPTAEEALMMRYFVSDEPSPEMPDVLDEVKGEWHEYESKRARRKAAAVIAAGLDQQTEAGAGQEAQA
ncbi:hypothetical protein ACM66B_005471 [Microbotryomycetes sp. NB124-2]